MANIETLIKKMIDIHVKYADVYVNNGSLWLIFTEEKKWSRFKQPGHPW